jgi:quercetin dioxygenase-like cupin family protein
MITRRHLAVAAGGFGALAVAGNMHAGAQEQPTISARQGNGSIVITRNGSQPSGRGPANNFTGAVRVDGRFQAPDPARVSGASVSFEPGARTAWHSHPLGQTLIVTFGQGWAQVWGDRIEEIRRGDVIWIAPGAKHWHGATPTTAVTHIAIVERLDGRTTDWMEQVSDEQYRA